MALFIWYTEKKYTSQHNRPVIGFNCFITRTKKLYYLKMCSVQLYPYGEVNYENSTKRNDFIFLHNMLNKYGDPEFSILNK